MVEVQFKVVGQFELLFRQNWCRCARAQCDVRIRFAMRPSRYRGYAFYMDGWQAEPVAIGHHPTEQRYRIEDSLYRRRDPWHGYHNQR